MILFLKSKIGGGPDLFATPVQVEGYATKQGTYVATHASIRHKKLEKPGQGDLFAAPALPPALTDEQKKVLATLRAARKRLAEETEFPDPETVAALDRILASPAAIDAAEARRIIHEASSRWVERAGAAAKAKETDRRKEDAASPDALGELGHAAAEKELTSEPAVEAEKPAEKAPEEITPEPMPADLPKNVRDRLGNALAYLREIQEELDRTRASLDENAKIGGGGRYEAEAWEKFKGPVGKMRDLVERFRATAREKGIDLDKVIAELGGYTDVKPSPAALAYLAGAGAPAPQGHAKPIEWGVPAGTSKAERRRLNAAALAILDAKSDEEMTAEDRQALARYTGRGGIGDSLNEFYTDPAVASAMWSMLANAGFAGGDVLEPSSGTGVFLHTAPAGARVTAVELDPISARIARILHTPSGHDVHAASLERFATQDGRLFDAVVGNVPFGLRGSMIRDDKPDLTTAEAYFVDTSLDKTKDGGLVALIVPTGFMDSKNGRAVREQVMCKGEFLGAHRLPNSAFEASHTGVTSDIVIFRKRPQELAGALGALDQDKLQAVPGVWDPEFLSGSYFTEGRGVGNIMGRMEEGWRAKAGMGQDITVVGSMAGIPDALAQWQPPPQQPVPTMESLLEGASAAERKRIISAALKPPYQVAKPGDIRVINGVRYVLQGDPPRWHRAEDEMPTAVEDAQAIGEMLDDLAEGRSRDPRFIRAKLAEALDDYVKEHGVPSRNRDLVRWMGAPHLPIAAGWTPEDHASHVKDTARRVARLLGAVGEDGAYSDLVTGRTRSGDGGTLDLAATKLALRQPDGFTVDQLAAAWGKSSADEILDHLMASPAYAINPDGQTWTTMDSYIGGELWPKLDAARAAASHEGIQPAYRAKYETQAKALEEAIDPQSLDDVEVAINSGFITPEVLTQWFDARRAEYAASHSGSTWTPGHAVFSFGEGVYTAKTGNGHQEYLPHEASLILKYLNRDRLKRDDLPTIDRLNDEFRTWLLGSDLRDRVETAYNRNYRGFRAPAFSDEPMAIPGLNPALDVNRYHFSGVRWALANGTGIVAADVGLGKTGRALMLAKLAKLDGQAKKPTIVVPKSVLSNWVKEAEFWFPGSKVLVIGESYATDRAGNVKAKSDDEETRRRKYHELQQNDYDFVFISAPAWNDLDVDPIAKGEYVDSDFWVQRGDALGNAGSKRINQIRTAYEQAKAKREFGKREATVYFGDLGIDMLILDEAHAYKNLYSIRKRFGESPMFLGGGGESIRAQDTYFKTRQLRDANGGRGVFMLTATPTKNSPLEVYSMLSHIAPEAFDRMGIKTSEDFIDRFCEFTEDNVLGLDGKIDKAMVTAGFKNLDELREVMRRYIDRKTAEDVGLKLPTADRQTHMVEMTAAQKEEYAKLRELAQKDDGDATGESHVFSIMDKMQKAALDMALLDDRHVRAESPKIAACVANVVKGVADGGQVIFCEPLATHDRIVADLVKAGIPRNQIAVVNAQACPTSDSRQKISDDFNAGKLKVVVGNKTMEEGMNLQKQTTDIHHLDLPWEPASLQQRNGRGLRQGNKSEAVRIHTYLAKGSFDGYRYQTILAKKDWQDLLWNGGNRVENLARSGMPSHNDMLIMLSADPEAAREKYESDKVAAEQRHEAEQTGNAIDMFGRFQEMRRSMASLRSKGANDSTTYQRLEQKSGRLKDLLETNKYFVHKDLLNGAEPALVDINSHYVFRRDAAFELAAGRGGPMAYSDRPTRWVVTGVNPDRQTFDVRPWAGDPDHVVTLSLDRTKAGVSPFKYDAAEEKTEFDARAKAKADALAATVAARQADKKAEGPKLDKLHELPSEVLEGMAPQLQSVLKDAIAGYKEHGWTGQNYATVGPDGAAQLTPRYSMKDGHDLLLPTDQGKQKAVDALVNDWLGRTLVDRMVSGRRGSQPKKVGITARYPSMTYGDNTKSPWEPVVHNGFGPHTYERAKSEFKRRLMENIAAAPDAAAVFNAAGPGFALGEYGTGHTWPRDVAEAMRTRLDQIGALDESLATIPRRRYGAPVHSDVLDLGDAWNPKRSIRTYLDRFAPPEKNEQSGEAA